MRAVYLPGGRQVTIENTADPEPGPYQVVVATRASMICGSDLRAIYREHLGEGAEAYRGVVAGHEPAGRVIGVGERVTAVQEGDRVAVYHISGCGFCDECRRGYQISCTSPDRAAYGWQRDGGHADRLLCEERDLLVLPDELSYVDGAVSACAFGTAYEAACRVGVSGRDQLLVVGLGPVGVAAGLLGKALGAHRIVGVDPVRERRDLAVQLGAVDNVATGTDEELRDLTGDGAQAVIECSGNGQGQALALRHTARWGRAAMVGEGGQLSIDVSQLLIHRQLTVYGSWVTSTVRMAELLDRCARWGLRPEQIVTRTFELAQAAEAYALADSGHGGKVGIVWPD